MCNVIYLGAIGLLLLYGDDLFAQYALAVVGPDGPMVVATGWSLARELWPLVALGAVVGSAVTLAFTRAKKKGTTGNGRQESCHCDGR